MKIGDTVYLNANAQALLGAHDGEEYEVIIVGESGRYPIVIAQKDFYPPKRYSVSEEEIYLA